MNQMRTEIAAAAVAPIQINSLVGEQSFSFKSDFAGFAGHFPNFPILPAVLQMVIAQMVAEAVIGVPVILKSVNRAKFRQQIKPDEQIDVYVTCREKGESIQCKSELTVGGKSAASFTLVLAKITNSERS